MKPRRLSTAAPNVATAPTGATSGKQRKESNRIRRENAKREIRAGAGDAAQESAGPSPGTENDGC
jgi:hypothetical protein